MTDKQLLLDTIRALPDDVTLEQACEEFAILAALHQARRASAEGRTFTVAEAREELAIRTAIWRAERELDAGRGIPHEDVVRMIAEKRHDRPAS